MALKAGYYGIKKFIADKLNRMNPGDSFATDAEIAAAADKVRADIAPVLEEAKAPAGGITAGDQFYLNDILYTATADIAAGADIVTTGEGKNADVSSNVTQQITAAVQQLTNSKVDNSVIGTVEDGTTASRAYAVGEHFIRNGAFCTVTQAISSGGTLTEGTNFINGDVAGLFARYDCKSELTPASNVTITDSYKCLCGNLLTYQLKLSATENLAVNDNLINSGLIKAFSSSPGIATAVFCDTDGNDYIVRYWSQSGNPILRVFTAIPSGKEIRGTISYII